MTKLYALFILTICALPSVAQTSSTQDIDDQAPSHDVLGQFYVTNIAGDDAEITSGDRNRPAQKAEMIAGAGLRVVTGDQSRVSMVGSNGAGIMVAEQSELRVLSFAQEPFAATGIHVDEPSKTLIEGQIVRGNVAFCTGQPAYDSKSRYRMPVGTLSLPGGRLLVKASDNIVEVLVANGRAKVFSGKEISDKGTFVEAGQKAVLTMAQNGDTSMEILPIPPADMPSLKDIVGPACQQRKMVAFGLAKARSSNGSGSGEIESQRTVPPSLPAGFVVSPANIGSK